MACHVFHGHDFICGPNHRWRAFPHKQSLGTHLLAVLVMTGLIVLGTHLCNVSCRNQVVMTSALAMHDHLLRLLLHQHCGYEVSYFHQIWHDSITSCLLWGINNCFTLSENRMRCEVLMAAQSAPRMHKDACWSVGTYHLASRAPAVHLTAQSLP